MGEEFTCSKLNFGITFSKVQLGSFFGLLRLLLLLLLLILLLLLFLTPRSTLDFTAIHSLRQSGYDVTKCGWNAMLASWHRGCDIAMWLLHPLQGTGAAALLHP